MLLTGHIRTGSGDFSYWLNKLESLYTAKTGLKLYPGTLNVHLLPHLSFPTPPNSLRLEKEEYQGSVSVSIIPCRIFTHKAFILRPDSDDGKLGDPPDRILEIATTLHLRSLHHLQDGDLVQVEV